MSGQAAKLQQQCRRKAHRQRLAGGGKMGGSCKFRCNCIVTGPCLRRGKVWQVSEGVCVCVCVCV